MITDNDILQATAYIKDVDINTVGALVESFKVSGTAIDSTAYQGVNSTNFNVLATTRGISSSKDASSSLNSGPSTHSLP